MSSLASCSRCQGFVADLARACPHCDAAPSRWRRLARVLSVAVVGAFSMTLMACYGAMPSQQDDCYDYGDCSGCDEDIDCPSGEYCDGTCVWSGTCAVDEQCPPEMFCDVTRATCRPGTRLGCDSHDDCIAGAERCDPVTRTCELTNPCGVGLLGCEEGFACDSWFAICVPCDGDACGTCAGEVVCGDPPPTCADGSQPAITAAGCYTGGCVSDATCAAEVCGALDETACGASDACNPVYGGVNCSNPDGEPCSGGASCTCESFIYLDCVVAPPPPPV